MAEPTTALADRIAIAWLTGRPMTTREVSDTARAVVHAHNGGHWHGHPDDPHVTLTVRATQHLQRLARRGEISRVKGPTGRYLWFAGVTVDRDQEAAEGLATDV